jgi:hypothetical protein
VTNATSSVSAASSRRRSTGPARSPLRRLAALAGCAVLVGALGSCDFLDPTEVTNPRTTREDLAAAPRPTAALLPGVRAQFARALGAVVITSETVSDNYMIRATGLSSELDDPSIIIPDVGTLNTAGPLASTGAYWNLQELQALATFTLEVAGSDPAATAAQIAETHYYRGMARLMLGENFVAVPIEPNGLPQSSRALVQIAVTDLERVIQLDPGGAFELRTRAALARAFRVVGDAARAESLANQVLAAGADFVALQEYATATNEVSNAPFTYTTVRGLREMQPLPRLDFLDPKYTSLASPIPVGKAEEMHLILAEVAVSRGDLGTARAHIANALSLALSRPRASFNDTDPRNNANLTVRPRDAFFQVRSDPQSPFRSGLIQSRPGNVTTPTISGTSLNPDSVRTLPVRDPEAILHSLYPARQETFFL